MSWARVQGLDLTQFLFHSQLVNAPVMPRTRAFFFFFEADGAASQRRIRCAEVLEGLRWQPLLLFLFIFLFLLAESFTFFFFLQFRSLFFFFFRVGFSPD